MRVALAAFTQDIEHVKRVADWLGSPAAVDPVMLASARSIGCGCLVLLSGNFESFLRECMRAFVNQVNALNIPFQKLPMKMRRTHFKNGVRALLQQAGKDREIGGTSGCEEIAGRLASVGQGVPYALVWEAFADTQSNPGPKVLNEMMTAVGVNDVWKQVMARVSGRGNLQTFLESFIALRNECAHTGSVTSPPLPSTIVEYGENLLAIGGALTALLEERLVALRPRVVVDP